MGTDKLTVGNPGILHEKFCNFAFDCETYDPDGHALTEVGASLEITPKAICLMFRISKSPNLEYMREHTVKDAHFRQRNGKACLCVTVISVPDVG